MAFGPIDIIALEFKGNEFTGDIISDVADLISSEVIRILDLVIVKKSESGETVVQELDELEPETRQIFDQYLAEISEMITIDDIMLIAKSLKNDTSAAIMLFENLWAVKLKQDIKFVGGRMVMHERIPKEVVDEALTDLAAFE